MKRRPANSGKGSGNLKSENILVRLDPAEKEAFKNAAVLAGQALSVWVRDRLRLVAQKELENANLPVPFFPKT